MVALIRSSTTQLPSPIQPFFPATHSNAPPRWTARLFTRIKNALFCLKLDQMSKRYFWLTPAARKRFLCRMAARCLGPGLTNELWDKIDSLENPGSQTEHNSGASTIWWFRMDGRRNWSERSNGFHPTVIDIRWQGLVMMTGGPNGEVDNESLDIDNSSSRGSICAKK